jgi:hypothetical protein
MKKTILFSVMFSAGGFAFAQPAKTKYPEPEFANEIYLLRKDSTVWRLEKNASKMDTKIKMGGFGGAENGYVIEGEKSPVRISSGENLSFVFSTGASAGKSSAASDSVMRANGMDPAAMSEMMGGMQDPANTISLYKTESGKGQRKILLQKSPGMLGFGAKKAYLNDNKKYAFSIKKVREGYWELVIDKPLAKGEYAFTMMGGMSGMDGSTTIFAFAVDY